jgi:hypothetical protein
VKLKCDTCRQPFDPQGKALIKYANRTFCSDSCMKKFVEAHEKYFGKPFSMFDHMIRH